MERSKQLLQWATIAVLATSCGEPQNEDAHEAKQRLINGDTVANPEDVGHVNITRAGGSGSGYLLRNDWALTAAHVLQQKFCPPGEPRPGNERLDCKFDATGHVVELGNSTSMDEKTGIRVSVHPGYVSRPGVESGVDVALIQTEPFTVNGSSTNINRSISSTDPTLHVGDNIFCYGYGRATIDPPAIGNGFGTVRSGQLEITGVTGADYNIQPLSAPPVGGQALIGGDSGGPCTFEDPAGGAPTLIQGINRTHADLVTAASFQAWAENVMSSVADFNYDWDDDGVPDAMFWMLEGSEIRLYAQANGTSTVLEDTGFVQSITFLGDLSTLQTAVGDFDGDSDKDVVLVTTGNRFYRLGPDNEQSFWEVPLGPHVSAAAQDIDGDGVDDLQILERDDRGFGEHQTYHILGGRIPTNATVIRAYATLDSNDDSVTDLAMLTDGGSTWSMRYKVSDGAGGFDFVGGVITNTTVDKYLPMKLVTGDFNKEDDRDDVVAMANVAYNPRRGADVWYFEANAQGTPVSMQKLKEPSASDPAQVIDIEATDFGREPGQMTPADEGIDDVLMYWSDGTTTLHFGKAGGPEPDPFQLVTGLPTTRAEDGKLLTVTGEGRGTFRSPYLEFKLVSTLEDGRVQVFDPNDDGAHDSIDAEAETCFQVWSAPCENLDVDCVPNGEPRLLTDSITLGSSLEDNEWATIFDGSQLADPAPSADEPLFAYRIVAYLSTTGDCGLDRGDALEEANTAAEAVAGWNGFKIRAAGVVSYQFGELQFIASDAVTEFSPNDTPISWVRDTEYDGRFEFFFDVGAAVDAPDGPGDADIILSEADADDTGDPSHPGVAVGATSDIHFQVARVDGSTRTFAHMEEILDITDPNTTIALCLPEDMACTVQNPSGNFDFPSGTDDDREHFKVAEADEQSGTWVWIWENVWVQNNIHIWAPTASPVAWEMYGAPVTRPKLTSALDPDEWQSGELSATLPVLLGTTYADGTPAGESVLLENVSDALDNLQISGSSGWDRLTRELTAAKLNIARAGQLQERLDTALIYGKRRSVSSLLKEADELFRGPRELASVSDVESVGVLLSAMNRGEVTYFRPGVPLAGDPAGDDDGDGVVNVADNCPPIPNPNQRDSNADDVGDACATLPILSCVLPLGEGEYRAYLGYENPLEYRSIPVSANNLFEGATADRGQPTDLEFGVHERVFTVEFSAGETLVWSLEGNSLEISEEDAQCSGIEFTQIEGLQDVALFGSEAVHLHDSVEVRGPGGPVSVVSGDSFELGADARIDEGWSRGDAFLRSNSEVVGAMTSATSIEAQQGATAGHLVDGGFVPEHTLDWSVPFVGGPSVPLEPDETASLPAGSWGAVSVKRDAELQLGSGVYHFDSLIMDVDSTLLLEGVVVIYVAGDLIWRGTASTTTGEFPELMIAAFGEQAVVEAPFRGTLIAPSALITLATVGAVHEGVFFGKRIDVAAHQDVVFHPLTGAIVIEPCDGPSCELAPPPVSGVLNVASDWGEGFCLDLEITNSATYPLAKWAASIDLNGTTITGSWNATFSSNSGNVTVTPFNWNAVIGTGESNATVGFCGERIDGSSSLPVVVAAAGN